MAVVGVGVICATVRKPKNWSCWGLRILWLWVFQRLNMHGTYLLQAEKTNDTPPTLKHKLLNIVPWHCTSNFYFISKIKAAIKKAGVKIILLGLGALLKRRRILEAGKKLQLPYLPPTILLYQYGDYIGTYVHWQSDSILYIHSVLSPILQSDVFSKIIQISLNSLKNVVKLMYRIQC